MFSAFNLVLRLPAAGGSYVAPATRQGPGNECHDVQVHGSLVACGRTFSGGSVTTLLGESGALY